MQNARQGDMPLVEAYLARRALDYLVGFNLSPVLWRKLPGARSAGRVQSVCLRIIVEREMEIEAFNPKEYWSVKALLETPRGKTFEARLTTLAGKKRDKMSLDTATAAELAVQAVSSRALSIKSGEAKPSTRNPSAPFMTSTLQQEASRKFGFGARQTMNAAQRLYEAGHITYMRTDGIDMAPEAMQEARAEIAREGPGWAGALGGLATEALVDRTTQRDDYLLASRYTLELSDDPDEAWVFLGVATRFVELQRPASLREDETSE